MFVYVALTVFELGAFIQTKVVILGYYSVCILSFNYFQRRV